MGVGCEALSKLIKNKVVSDGVFGGILLYLLVLVLSGHPYQYTYLNQLVKRPAEDNWDMDYWCVSSYQALEQLYHSGERNQEHALTVTGREAVLAEVISFPDKWNYEMEYVAPDSGLANYVVINRNYDTMQQEGYHLLFTIDAYGNRLYEVYERD